MATAVPFDSQVDDTRIPLIVRSGIILGVVEAVFVIIVSLITKNLGGFVEHFLTGVAVYIGAMIVIFYPGTITRPRTIEGIAGAAGIGLTATWVIVPINAFILEPFNFYTNRWYQVGGWSNWWYLPVWWMVGTFASWMGGWILANRANRTGTMSVPFGMALVTIVAFVIGAVATFLHFPGAGWHAPTFAIALIPALAVSCALSAIGRRQT